MKNLRFKISAAILICLLVQACSSDEITPRVESDISTHSTASEAKTKNAFSVVVRPWDLEFPYGEISFEGAVVGKKLTVNWGDGIEESYTFEEGFGGKPRIRMEHYYTSMQQFTIRVTGDIDNIIGVSDPFTSLETFSINFDKLRNLETVDMPYNSFVSVDVSKNHKLRVFQGTSSTLTTNVVLPTTHQLRFVASGSPNLPTPVVSAMIASVYKNAVKNKTYNGTFELASGMAEDPKFPGPPTEADMAKLIALRDVYGWTIFPNP